MTTFPLMRSRRGRSSTSVHSRPILTLVKEEVAATTNDLLALAAGGPARVRHVRVRSGAQNDEPRAPVELSQVAGSGAPGRLGGVGWVHGFGVLLTRYLYGVQEGAGASGGAVDRFEAAFVDFYRREHAGQVRRAYLLTASSAVAHDLVHDAFVAVYERWDLIESPGGYLNRSVVNACNRYGRQASRLVVVESVESQIDDDRSVADYEAVELAELLMDLPFRQRGAIVLRLYAGMTESEIAVALGCRPGSVGPLIHRGLKRLKEAMS